MFTPKPEWLNDWENWEIKMTDEYEELENKMFGMNEILDNYEKTLQEIVKLRMIITKLKVEICKLKDNGR